MFSEERFIYCGPKRPSIAKGFTGDHPLDMENPDLRKRADSIFRHLKAIMLDTTVVIADLEAYRGSEPDSGTIYELGMAYAKGARCYKDQEIYAERGRDEHGKEAPYKDLPFSP